MKIIRPVSPTFPKVFLLDKQTAHSHLDEIIVIFAS